MRRPPATRPATPRLRTITDTATGHASFNKKAVDSNTVTVHVTTDGGAGALGLVKTPDPKTFTAAGDVITYTYTLTNTGDTTLAGPFTVTDNKATVTCPDDTTLAPGASLTCTATYAITGADVSAGKVINTATAHGESVDSDTVTAEVDLHSTESFGGATGTPHRTPPATSSSKSPANGGPASLLILLICLSLGLLGIAGIQFHRRAVKRS